jgi:hypothetical protein
MEFGMIDVPPVASTVVSAGNPDRPHRRRCQQVAKANCDRLRLRVYECIFLHNHRAVAGVGRFVERKTAKGFFPRSD